MRPKAIWPLLLMVSSSTQPKLSVVLGFKAQELLLQSGHVEIIDYFLSLPWTTCALLGSTTSCVETFIPWTSSPSSLNSSFLVRVPGISSVEHLLGLHSSFSRCKFIKTKCLLSFQGSGVAIQHSVHFSLEKSWEERIWVGDTDSSYGDSRTQTH